MQKRIALMPNPFNDVELNVTTELVVESISNRVVVTVTSDIYNMLMAKEQISKLDNKILVYLKSAFVDDVCKSSDLAIAVGGDGSILEAGQYALKADIPIIGINKGRLGYLAKVDEHQIKSLVACLINDNYTIEKRAVLKISVIPLHQEFYRIFPYAINDLAIEKTNGKSIVVNQTLGSDTLTYTANGVVISTPTGSTAYSYAAFGPIIDTEAKAMVVTPIVSFQRAVSSMVISAGKRMEFTVGDPTRREKAMLSIDGQEVCRIDNPNTVEVEVAKDKYLKLIIPQEDEFLGKTFYKTVITKSFGLGF